MSIRQAEIYYAVCDGCTDTVGRGQELGREQIEGQLELLGWTIGGGFYDDMTWCPQCKEYGKEWMKRDEWQ